MRRLLQFSACFALGLCIAGVLLIGMMLVGRFDWIELLMLSGWPFAQLGLQTLPAPFWNALAGVTDAPANATVQSFLQLCVAMMQIALLFALGFFHLWYRR
ncbi:hypothetical protein DNK06_08430 [Pseudomonas daroniae]|uniref:Uncharacterized protein n=1 Tax=Phytopseudomonas daroniae TaxID=2487519 RepID=A0A4Q9QP56_9GAMM|nr:MULTISPECIES: hypothetical protein [Pseudomonas]TBU81130.1 hypothetical protein DNK06_08430 [Pseudomonas daroniae]TBU83655.1 hypothetical protein DNK31_09195 [Pseudomonas sp. FRB 228]TBU89412.1 hypothetical protein DNJ99_16925 [Pseudomonas daroniae]